MNGTSRKPAPEGQTLVIVALAMVVLVAMVGVVIDVGFEWAANRDAQNGTDATAHAGAVVLMRHMAAGDASLLDDDDVDAAVNAMADETGIDIVSAEYTDYLGATTIGVDVGDGGPIPAGAQGVYVVASETHETLLAKVVGITELTATTDAAAVAGPTEEPCPDGQSCALLPVTFPNTQVTCDGQNRAVPTELPWQLGVDLVLPLCGNFPGGVGWIDWDVDDGGGNSELAAEICSPDVEVNLPDWFYVTQTGNTNSDPVQTCFERWLNKPILVPLFDDMCRIDPLADNPCPAGEPPSGQNSWYHFPTYASFFLTGVYIQGHHPAECDTGNGATSCLHGKFVDTSGTGTVGQYIPPNPNDPPVTEFFTVQLMR
jgi:putative Flp pilus-assembly TadE/G-like protein